MDTPLDPQSSDDEKPSTGEAHDDVSPPDLGDGGDDDGGEERSEHSSHLLEEYRLLQGKLDRLGDFRFRVKSWAITLSLGLIVVSPKADPIVLGGGGVLLILAFGLLERHHYEHVRLFGTRLSRLESILSGHEVRSSKHRHALKSEWIAISHVTTEHWETMPSTLLARAWHWMLRYANGLFYLFLIAIVSGAAVVGMLDQKAAKEKEEERKLGQQHQSSVTSQSILPASQSGSATIQPQTNPPQGSAKPVPKSTP